MDYHGKPYYSLDAWCKNTYGEKLYKIALDAGLTCPNRDGTLDTRGCIFCSAGGSGDFTPGSALSIPETAEPRPANSLASGPKRRAAAISLIFRPILIPTDLYPIWIPFTGRRFLNRILPASLSQQGRIALEMKSWRCWKA